MMTDYAEYIESFEGENERDQVELMIDLIQTHPCIWDVRHPKYKLIPAKNLLYTEIGLALGGVSGSDIKKKWKNLRDRYMKEVKGKKELSGSGTKIKKPWCHFERLGFLRDSTEFLTTSSNLARVPVSMPVCPSRPTHLGSVSEGDDEGSVDDPLSLVPKKADHAISWDPSEAKRKRSKRDLIESALLKELAGPSVPVPSSITKDADADYFSSLVPAYKRLDTRAQAKLKMDISKLFFDAEFPPT